MVKTGATLLYRICSKYLALSQKSIFTSDPEEWSHGISESESETKSGLNIETNPKAYSPGLTVRMVCSLQP